MGALLVIRIAIELPRRLTRPAGGAAKGGIHDARGFEMLLVTASLMRPLHLRNLNHRFPRASPARPHLLPPSSAPQSQRGSAHPPDPHTATWGNAEAHLPA